MPSIEEWNIEAEKFAKESTRLKDEVQALFAKLHEITEDLTTSSSLLPEEWNAKLKYFNDESERLTKEIELRSKEFDYLTREFMAYTEQCPVSDEDLRRFDLI